MKILPNPFIVQWEHEADKWNEMGPWLRENTTAAYQIISLGRNGMLVYWRDHEYVGATLDLKDGGFTCLSLFESPRDAMLFKLTWVD